MYPIFPRGALGQVGLLYATRVPIAKATPPDFSRWFDGTMSNRDGAMVGIDDV